MNNKLINTPTVNRTFTTKLILNYTNGKFRLYSPKRKLTGLKHDEIPINIKLDISIPAKPVLNIDTQIDLTETQVKNINVQQAFDALVDD